MQQAEMLSYSIVCFVPSKEELGSIQCYVNFCAWMFVFDQIRFCMHFSCR